VPFGIQDPSTTGQSTSEGSRTLEVGGIVHANSTTSLTLFHKYAFEDFGIRQVAQLLGKADDVEKYGQRSLVRSSSAFSLFSADRT
jgi:putative alpha-1,2-mannosidase